MSLIFNLLQPLDAYQCMWVMSQTTICFCRAYSSRCSIQAISIGLVCSVMGMECMHVARDVSAKACVWLAAARWILEANIGSWFCSDNTVPFWSSKHDLHLCYSSPLLLRIICYVHMHVPCAAALKWMAVPSRCSWFVDKAVTNIEIHFQYEPSVWVQEFLKYQQ